MQSSPRIEELRHKFHENPRRYFAPLANEYRKAGDPEQAIAICRAHLAQQPGHMSGHVVYGQALYDAGRMDEAGVVFQQALALDPENIIVLRHLGDIARQRGDVEEARSWYSRALDGDPHDAEVAAYLAELTDPLTTAPQTQPEPPQEATSREIETAERETQHEAGVQALAQAQPESAEAEAEALAGAESEGLAAESAPVQAVTEAEAPAEAPSRRTPSRAATPVTETAPIVTRTLAELYLQQGYIEPALEIYRQLADKDPGDAGLQARVEELSSQGASAPLAGEADAAGAAASVEAAEDNGRPEMVSAAHTGANAEVIKDGESTAETAPSDELWDSADSWGDWPFTDVTDRADSFGQSEDIAESGQEAPEAAPKSEIVQLEREPESEAPEQFEPATEPQAMFDPGEKAEPGASYSRPPVTVREFFATLGAARPPSGGESETPETRAPVGPVTEPERAEGPVAQEQYPIADDAFASLFAGVPVDSEDSRAAAVLSGAVAHGAPVSTPLTSPVAPPPRDAQANRQSADPVQESEEDIRRFREWLDGLAES